MPYRLPLFIILLFTLLNGCSKPEPVEPPKIGDTIEGINFSTMDGSTLSLESQRGKLAIIHFWATWCAPCRKEMPALERLSQQLDPEKFALIAVSVDEEVEEVTRFLRQYGVRFARYIDAEMALASGRFGVVAYPETFLISKEGKLIRHMVGEHEWDSPAMIKVLNDAYAGVDSKSGAYW